MSDIISIVVAVVLVILAGAAFIYFNSFLIMVFPTLWVIIIDIIILVLTIKFIIGRNHG